MGLQLRDRLVDPNGRLGVAGHVPRPVDHVEHLPGVGQRHDQRMVAPDAFVGNVHALLALAAGRGQHPVDIEVGGVCQQVLSASLPHLRSHRVDGLHQVDDIRGVETATEIPRRGRVGDQLRTHSVHVGGVMTTNLDVLQPRTATQRVVGQIQHMVGLVIGQVHLQQPQALIDLFGQAQLGHQPMHHPDAAIAHRVGMSADLVVYRCGGEHRLRLRRPMSGLAVARLHLALAPGTVSATLFGRYSLHRKGLLWGSW